MKKINVEEVQKPWYISKTLLASLIVIAIGALGWTQGQIEAGLPVTFLGVLMAIMRIITTKKLIK